MVNEQNYKGVNTTIVAYAAGTARPPAYDKQGTSGVLEISLPISEGYKKDGEWVEKSTTWYVYSGAGDFAQNVLSQVKKGDKIRVDDAKQEVREYTDREGNPKLGITLRYGDFTVLESPGANDSSGPF